MNYGKTVLLVSICVISGRAFAWGDMGHETIAHIAQMFLTKEAKTQVQDNLGPELLSIAATWPDAVRDDEEYKPFADYHLCDEPKAGISVENYRKQMEHNCLAVFDKGPGLLKLNDAQFSVNAKMLVMRYIIHVTGDIHQPLHIGGGVDLGANTCKVNNDGREENLHHFWDTTLIDGYARRVRQETGFKGFFGAKQVAEYLVKKNAKALLGRDPLPVPEQKDKSKPKAVLVQEDIEAVRNHASTVAINAKPEKCYTSECWALRWIQESADLRKTVVYPDHLSGPSGVTVTDNKQRPYCSYVLPTDPPHTDHFEFFKKDMIPKISDEWELESQKIALEQIWKAGMRLAALLNEIATQLPPVTPDKSMNEVKEGMSNKGAPKDRKEAATKGVL